MRTIQFAVAFIKREHDMAKRLTKAQRQLLLAAIDAINSDIGISTTCALRNYVCNSPAESVWFDNVGLDWPIWSAGENMPGYMPDSPYCLFLTERAARGHCRALEREPGGSAYVSDYMPVTLREML